MQWGRVTMALVCTEVREWIEEKISKPVEEWEERQKKKCKKRKWYDPRGWVCWFVTYFVKVVRWVVVTVGKWVTRTVCKLVGALVGLVQDLLGGLWDVVAGIFTLDWRRILDGLIGIGLGVVVAVFGIGRIVLLGDTIEFIIEEINRSRLRSHVRSLLEASEYSGDTLAEIKAAIRLDHGAFGLRLRAEAYRVVLDSQAPSPTDPTAPNLWVLDEDDQINLRALCGFEIDEGFWNRKRYKTLKTGVVVTGGGGGELDNPISESELATYIQSRGADGPSFVILPMRDGVLDTKLSAGSDKGRQLGLIISWDMLTADITTAMQIVQPGYDTGQANAHASLTSFLDTAIGRTRRPDDPMAARDELCTPAAVGVFRFTDNLRGLANRLERSACGQQANDASGVTFIDNRPDHIWKYVPIHELGHYFGLCHVDGLDRIMVSAKEKSPWSWSLIPNLVYLRGEPYFTLDEAKAVWDEIVDEFDPTCLGARPRPVIVD
jgi:hypothetical protein